MAKHNFFMFLLSPGCSPLGADAVAAGRLASWLVKNAGRRDIRDEVSTWGKCFLGFCLRGNSGSKFFTIHYSLYPSLRILRIPLLCGLVLHARVVGLDQVLVLRGAGGGDGAPDVQAALVAEGAAGHVVQFS